MMCACISHYGWIYYMKGGSYTLYKVYTQIGFYAAPAFILVSGCMQGFYYRNNVNGSGTLIWKYIDKGLFILTVAHAAMTFSVIYVSGSLFDALRWGFVTDTIAIGMIFGAILIPRTDIRQRFFIGMCLFIASTLLLFNWTPDRHISKLVKFTLVGSFHDDLYIDNFPFLPWLAVYIHASIIGERISVYLSYCDEEGMKSYITRIQR